MKTKSDKPKDPNAVKLGKKSWEKRKNSLPKDYFFKIGIKGREVAKTLERDEKGRLMAKGLSTETLAKSKVKKV